MCTPGEAIANYDRHEGCVTLDRTDAMHGMDRETTRPVRRGHPSLEGGRVSNRLTGRFPRAGEAIEALGHGLPFCFQHSQATGDCLPNRLPLFLTKWWVIAEGLGTGPEGI